MSISRPAGMPSMVMTSAWPWDSPALRNLSIRAHLNTEETAGRGGARAAGGAWRPARRVASRSVVLPSAERLARDQDHPQVRSPARLHAAASRLSALSPAVAEQLQRARRAHVFASAGRHAAAERLLRDVAGALARRGAREPRARVLIELCRLLLARGRAGDARRASADAREAANEAGAGRLA